MNQLIHNSSPKIPNSEFRIPNLKRAFTLIELLIVIAIIGVLTAMSLTLLAGASNDAKISATQARISQITNILQLQMEDYEVRRLPIANRVLQQYIAVNRIQIDGNTEAKNDRLQLKYLRRQLLMALIDSEMPRPARMGAIDEAFSYGGNPNAGSFPSSFDLSSNMLSGAQQFGQESTNFRDWIALNYAQQPTGGAPNLVTLLDRNASGVANKWQQLGNGRKFNEDTPELYPAEFLYEILSSIQIDGQSAVELLGNSAIANDDNDDFPEIVDAWGEPLIFDIEQPLADAAALAQGRVIDDVSGSTISLDPRQPRSLRDVRIVVGSARVPETLPAAERAKRGLQ